MTESLSIDIDAPRAVVFEAVSNVENLPATVPEIERTELLSETKRGVGTRFREVRRMGKKEAVTELEVTEFEPDHRVRMVAENNGTVWDTTFIVTDRNGGSRLELVMEARTDRLFSRIMIRLVRGMMRRAVEKHVGHVKSYCERVAGRA